MVLVVIVMVVVVHTVRPSLSPTPSPTPSTTPVHLQRGTGTAVAPPGVPIRVLVGHALRRCRLPGKVSVSVPLVAAFVAVVQTA